MLYEIPGEWVSTNRISKMLALDDKYLGQIVVDLQEKGLLMRIHTHRNIAEYAYCLSELGRELYESIMR